MATASRSWYARSAGPLAPALALAPVWWAFVEQPAIVLVPGLRRPVVKVVLRRQARLVVEVDRPVFVRVGHRRPFFGAPAPVRRYAPSARRAYPEPNPGHTRPHRSSVRRVRYQRSEEHTSELQSREN